MTDPREPIAVIKARHDEAHGEPIEIKPIPFYSHPQLGASVSVIGFFSDAPLYVLQRTTST